MEENNKIWTPDQFVSQMKILKSLVEFAKTSDDDRATREAIGRVIKSAILESKHQLQNKALYSKLSYIPGTHDTYLQGKLTRFHEAIEGWIKEGKPENLSPAETDAIYVLEIVTPR